MDARSASRLDGALWLGIGALTCAASLRLPLAEQTDTVGWLPALPGPGFFPLLLGLALSSLGVLMLSAGRAHVPAAVTGPRLDRRTASVVVGLLLYAAVLETLGFVIATLLFLVVLLRGVSEHRLPVALAMAAAASLSAWLVFRVWLGAQLPAGILAR